MRKFILGTIFGITISVGVVYAVSYYAKDVSYQPNDASWEVSNVNDAINSLYDNVTELKSLGDATASDILEGKTALVQGELIEGTGSINVPILTISTVNYNSDNGYNYTTIIFDTTKAKKVIIDDMFCQHNILNSVYVKGSKDGGQSWETLKVISSATNVSDYRAHEYDIELDISEYDQVQLYIRIATTAATYGFGYKGINFY